MFDDRTGHADDIGFLKRVFADEAGRDLSGDDDHGDGIHISIGDSGQQIGGSGTAGRHADAGFSGDAGVTVGGECAALFIAGQDDTDGGVLERLMEFDRRSAGIGKNGIDSESFQGFDRDFRAFDRQIVLIGSCHNDKSFKKVQLFVFEKSNDLIRIRDKKRPYR